MDRYNDQKQGGYVTASHRVSMKHRNKIQFKNRNGLRAQILVESIESTDFQSQKSKTAENRVRISQKSQKIENFEKVRDSHISLRSGRYGASRGGYNKEGCYKLAAGQIFENYDFENKGFIDNNSIRLMLIDIYGMINKKFEPSEAQILGFKKMLDLDKDGYISPKDVLNGIRERLD